MLNSYLSAGDQARVPRARDPAAGLHQHPQRPAPRGRQRRARAAWRMGDGELSEKLGIVFNRVSEPEQELAKRAVPGVGAGFLKIGEASFFQYLDPDLFYFCNRSRSRAISWPVPEP